MTNLQGEIQGIINNYIEELFDQLVNMNGMERGVLESMWSKITASVGKPDRLESQPSRIEPIDMNLVDQQASPPPAGPAEPVGPEGPAAPTRDMIMNATVAELKALCKAHKLPVGGKKQDLTDRLVQLSSMGGSVGESVGVPPAPKKKKRSPNRMPQIPISSIQIKKNAHGNYEHPETNLVFDKDSRQVIGKQKGDGTINPLCEEDIQQCDQFKFTYRIPEKIMNEADKQLSSKTASDDIVETLEDIIGSDEEFEEFYEETED